jgi:hypothetical protein
MSKREAAEMYDALWKIAIQAEKVVEAKRHGRHLEMAVEIDDLAEMLEAFNLRHGPCDD